MIAVVKSLVRVLLPLLVCTACAPDPSLGAAWQDNVDRSRHALSGDVVPEDFRVAIFGDSSLNDDARAVMRLVREEQAQMVLHLGDFDYRSDPEAWEAMLDETLGSEMPFFAVAGNHDRRAWPAYREFLERRAAQAGAVCTGELGVQSACTYRGLFMVLVAPGVMGSDHDAYIREQLAHTGARWRICAWHRNQRRMQIAGKSDGVGWGPYEACRQAGAFVVSGHAHTYSRTHLLSSFEKQTVVATGAELKLADGNSFAVVSGLGGRFLHRQRLEGPWFAATRARGDGAQHGALFCEFNAGGVESRTNCYFKEITREVHDRFTIIAPDGGAG